MINPEFKRNLWLSFSMHRLIAMPALLGLIFLTVALFDHVFSALSSLPKLYGAAWALFIFVVWAWGGINANAAIVNELRDKTWDQQRMSALDPWSMTWGKLFGATSFNWYGGSICLLVLIFSGIATNRPDWMLDLCILIASGILLHATLIVLNLHIARFEMALIRRGGIGWIVIMLAVLALWPATIQKLGVYSPSTVFWWDIKIASGKVFQLASTLLFMTCAIFAAWRSMSNALQVRTLPWAWPLFALILAVYCGGFSNGKWFCLIGFAIAMAFSYAALLTEPNTLLVWNKLRLRLQAGDWRNLLADLPLWPATFLLVYIFALAAMLTSPVDTQWSQAQGPANLLVLAVLLLRDVGIVLFFSFTPNARRPVVVAVLYILVLNFLLPFLFANLGLHAVSYFFCPYRQFFPNENYGSGTALLIAAIHVAIALSLVAWRFNKTRRQTNQILDNPMRS